MQIRKIKISLIIFPALFLIALIFIFYNFKFLENKWKWTAQLTQSPSVCGDGVCESDESSDSCPIDCWEKPFVALRNGYLDDMDDELGTCTCDTYPAPCTTGQLYDYQAAPCYLPDAMPDPDDTIQRLKNANINTYYYLFLYQSWDQFIDFLAKAKAANIDVYVWMDNPDPTKYGSDIKSAATDFATLSLTYPNLKGFSIDDFHYSLTPAYVAQMMRAAYNINPNFQFVPVLYWYDIGEPAELLPYKPYIDGVLYAYRAPGDTTETENDQLVPDINYFNRVCNSEIEVLYVENPWGSTTGAGDYVSFSDKVSDFSNKNFDYFTGNIGLSDSVVPLGWNLIQVGINGQTVFSDDAGNGSTYFGDYNGYPVPTISPNKTIDLSQYPPDATITFKVYSPQNGDNSPMSYYFFVPPGNWTMDKTPGTGYVGNIFPYTKTTNLIPSVYASPYGGDTNTPESVGNTTQICLQELENGSVQGVSEYALDLLNTTSPYAQYGVVQNLFSEYEASNLTPSAAPAIVSSNGSGGGGAGGSSLLPILLKSPVSPQGGFNVLINKGARSTSNRTVNLSFNAGSDIKKIAISMTGNFSDANIQSYQPQMQWDLCSSFSGNIKQSTCPNGKYTIYVKFYTFYGQPSQIASSNIFLSPATNGQ